MRKTYTSGCLLVAKDMSYFKLNIGLGTFSASKLYLSSLFQNTRSCSTFEEVDKFFTYGKISMNY